MEFVERGSYRDKRSSLMPFAPFDYRRMTIRRPLLPEELEEDKIHFKEISEYEPELTFEETLEKAGLGFFQYYLTFVCGLIYMTCAVSATAMSFVLPASSCKLAIMSHDRGVIISSGLVGMILGTFVWSAMADLMGKRATLLFCLAVESIAAIITAFSYHKYMLLLVRFFNGFGSIGLASLVFAYAGDFIFSKYKDYFLSSLEFFWGLGLIYIPVAAMYILPLKIHKQFGVISIQSWNVYSLVCAILPVISFILLSYLPESPVFFLYQHRFTKALRVLDKVSIVNRGIHLNVSVLEEDSKNHKGVGFLQSFKDVLHEQAELFNKKHLSNTLKVCSIAILINFSFLTISIWIPTLIDRYDYEKQMTGKELTCCSAAMHVGEFLETNEQCNDEITRDTYIFAIVISFCILPFTAAYSLALGCVGRNELLILLTVTTAVSILLLNIVVTKLGILLCCIFFQAADLIEALLLLIGIHLYPPNLCPIALSMIVTSGRVAAVLGNTMFGALVDDHCYFPMYLFAGTAFVAVLVEMSLPRVHT